MKNDFVPKPNVKEKGIFYEMEVEKRWFFEQNPLTLDKKKHGKARAEKRKKKQANENPFKLNLVKE